ncbi:MAG: GAF domain-containing sensor histidine kinase [Terrimicrobiaceae bacterium]
MSKFLPVCGQEIDNPARLDALVDSKLLDTLPEESFDRYTRIAAALLHSDVSLISLVDSDRQFFKSQVGLPPPYNTTRQTPLTHSFCQLVVQSGEPLIVEDARQDERVSHNLAIRDLGVISYLGMPVTSREGFLLGSLCAINSHPRVWSHADQSLLADLAGAVSTEIELRQSTAALKESLSILQDSDEQHEKSLHMLVHDLRTPAGAIVSLTELLPSLPPELSPDQKDLVDSCHESAENLLSMFGDLLTINKMRTAASPSRHPEVPVSQLLRRVARMIQPFVHEAAIQLTVDYPEHGGTIPADSRQIERVLLNLLTNAVKFSPAGSLISLSAAGATFEGKQGFRFEIADEGPGVPEDEKEAIFQQFFTGSIHGLRGMESFGIGLAFCKSAIEAHHGHIGVEDVPGGGSLFYFFLPASHAAGQSAPVPAISGKNP